MHIIFLSLDDSIKRMKRGLKITLGILVLLGGIYAIGPTPDTFTKSKEIPVVPSIHQLDEYVDQIEAIPSIKAGNNARIVWANDSIKEKTPYSIVYLHGFSASEKEGAPGHENIAKKFGCNLYLSRLQSHGVKEAEELLSMTSSGLYKSAQEALAIGKQLGEKVILMGTSTGGTLALMLTAEYPDDIEGLVLYSPNIEIYDPTAFLLNKPWGLEIARMVLGSDYNHVNNSIPEYRDYWNVKYRIEALTELQELLNAGMTAETFEKVKVPVYMAYYYKNEEEQDKTVSVAAMLEMFEQLGTDKDNKIQEAFPGAGSHVIASSITSGQYQEVETKTSLFFINVLGLNEKL